jgi:deoxyxylulose-5-phosphate synthase
MEDLMPWSPSDGPARHTKKANTPKKKRQWSKVANNVLERTADEGRAVRAANAAVSSRGTKFGKG